MQVRSWGAFVVLVLAISRLAPASPASAAMGAPSGGGPGSPWRTPVGDPYLGVHDGQGKPVGPNLWGTSRVLALWCAVQPIRGINVTDSARTRLDGEYAKNAANGVRRLNVTLGHPAAWVFKDAKAARSTKNVPARYCQHTLANTSFPTRKSLASGPVRTAYVEYVRAVIRASKNYLAANGANKLVLMAANEPNLRSSGQVSRTIPGAARSWEEAAASLQKQERIMRKVAQQMIPGRFEITSPAMYGKQNAGATAYFKAQAKYRTIDSISLNFYTFGVTPAKALASWRAKATRALKVVKTYQRLKRVPVWITETNHNLVNGNPRDRSNISSDWMSGPTQKHLAQATLAEAMRMGFAGIEFYQGSASQVALKYYPGTVAFQSTRSLFVLLAGRKLQKCTTTKSIVTCSFSARPIDGPVQLRWSAKGLSGVTVIGPTPLPPAPAKAPAAKPAAKG